MVETPVRTRVTDSFAGELHGTASPALHKRRVVRLPTQLRERAGGSGFRVGTVPSRKLNI
jgi:hypothetical protein